MSRRVLWLSLWTAMSLSLGCGGDDSGGDDGTAGTQGGSGQGGSSPGTAGGGMMIGGEGLACGTTRCQMPEGSTEAPCCIDEFSSTCGMLGGIGDSACVALVETDARCPSVSAGPISLPSCCTADNQCGLTSPAFGLTECTELSIVEQMAMDRAAMFDEGDADGGVDADGGTDEGGFSLDFPDPQSCE